MSEPRVTRRRRQREQLIMALLQQPAIEKAAAAVGISPVAAGRISKTPELTEESRQAIIEVCSCDPASETHLVMVSEADAPLCHFKEMPGSGPQLADFGDFSVILGFTPAEMEA